eukprot:scaffold5361_cov83-Skeletonema_dohrnii-CCMP3373.AAC.3
MTNYNGSLEAVDCHIHSVRYAMTVNRGACGHLRWPHQVTYHTTIAIVISLRSTKIADAFHAKGELLKERIWRLSSSALMSALCYSVKTLFTEYEGEVEEINVATSRPPSSSKRYYHSLSLV